MFIHIGWRDYSSWFIALWIVCFVYMALVLLDSCFINIPTWLWWWGFIYLFIGILFSFILKRLLWIRIYQTLGFVSVVACYIVLLWAILKANGIFGHPIWVGLTLALFSVGNVFRSYRRTGSQLGGMGYGLSGTLDVETGILDPSQSSPAHQRELAMQQEVEQTWLQWVPVIAGIAMFLVNIFSAQDIQYLIAIAAMGFLWLGTSGIGRFGYYSCWIHDWEQKHKLSIVLR